MQKISLVLVIAPFTFREQINWAGVQSGPTPGDFPCTIIPSVTPLSEHGSHLRSVWCLLPVSLTGERDGRVWTAPCYSNVKDRSVDI